MVGTLNQSEGGVHGGVRGGVHERGAWRFFKEMVGKKNQDFMLIRFLNAAI